jgi:hypothetical protein
MSIAARLHLTITRSITKQIRIAARPRNLLNLRGIGEIDGSAQISCDLSPQNLLKQVMKRTADGGAPHL